MSRYSNIKREFSFLISNYDFKIYMKQQYGSYYYLSLTNGKKDIMIIYDDTVDCRVESPVWIRIYDADSLGTAFDQVDEYRKEFAIKSGTPKERIQSAAIWLRNAIIDKTVDLGDYTSKPTTTSDS